MADHSSPSADKLRQGLRPTTIIEARRLSQFVGCSVILASETFQHTGSFKFRAALNVVMHSDELHFIAASSGNFGQALAYACQLLRRSCTIVMPSTSSKVKIDAVRGYGGIVDLIDTRLVSRADRVAQLAASRPGARVVSAYDDELVIDGNASLGDELAACGYRFDCLIVPIGGGGLAAGILRGLRRSGYSADVYAAEPFIANDAARSLRAGRIVANDSEPNSIADGARTLSVGKCNWPILQAGLSDILEVSEPNIEEGVRLLYSTANLKVEPTGALAVAALASFRGLFYGRKVCCIVSGGNVDPNLYAQIIRR
jgi:threonine dehydratase